MNERIQTLASEAEDYADDIVDQGGEFHEAYTKKFAELIVRECASFIDSRLETSWSGATDWADGEDLMTHFGIE